MRRHNTEKGRLGEREVFSASHETEACCGWSMDRAAAQTQRVRYTSCAREMQILSCPVLQVFTFQEKRNQFLASSFAIAVKESILSPWLCVVVAPLFLRAASMCVSIRRVHR